MSTRNNRTDETRVAEEIVSVLPAESIVRVCSDDRELVRFAIRDGGLKIQSVVLGRASLRRLLSDATRSAKIEYLKRELLAVASQRAEFRYPRGSHGLDTEPSVPDLPLASAR